MERVAASLCREWGIEGAELSPLTGGMNSQTWLVERGGVRYVAKVVSPGWLDGLTRGCLAAARLAEQGFVTGRPIPTTSGELVSTRGRMALLEHVPGRELTGETEEEQAWVAELLAGVHIAAGPTREHGAAFLEWLTPAAPGVDDHPWLAAAIAIVRAETDPLTVTWSLLHTDPSPEAFVHDDDTGVTGLIDWAGAQRGPVLYDVASTVMYLGGPQDAAAFLSSYAEVGPLDGEELRRLDGFRRFRWAVQGAYFAGRLAARDLTGIPDRRDNEKGLADARRGLDELGVTSTGS